MIRSIALYVFVCVVATIRALLMPTVLLFRSAEYKSNYYLAEDQAWNTVFNGMPDEAISARVRRTGHLGWVRFIDRLFADKSHCDRAYQAERDGSQNASEYKERGSQ